MAEPHVVSALTAKRAELAGEIELTTRKLQGLRAALRSLDETLCLFEPDAQPETIKPRVWRPKADWAKRGEMTAFGLDALRRAEDPLTSRDIALAFMTARGMDTENRRLISLIAKRFGFCLRLHRDAGLVVSEQGATQAFLWRLADDPT